MCTISINYATAIVTNGSITSITVGGALQGCSCNMVRVQTYCRDAAHPFPLVLAPVTNNEFSATYTDANQIKDAVCSCGSDVTVTVSCGGVSQTVTMPLECIPPPPPVCCPDINTVIEFGQCNPDGTREVIYRSTFWLTVACKNVSLQWDFEQAPTLYQQLVSDGIIEHVATRTLICGKSYSSTLMSLWGNVQCPDDTVAFDVPCCDNCCPTLQVNVKSTGPCNANGKREIIIEYIISPSSDPNCPLIEGSLQFPDSSTLFINDPLELTGTKTLLLNAGQSYTVTFNTISPPGCPPATAQFAVAACGNCCPQMNVKVKFGDCDANGNRFVTIDYIISPSIEPGCPPITGTLTVPNQGPININNQNLSGSVTIQVIAGQSYQVVFIPNTPTGCTNVAHSFNVPPCDCCPNAIAVVAAKVDKQCNDDLTKTVKVRAVVTPVAKPGCPTNVQAEMYIDGNMVASGSGTNPFQMNHTGDYGCGEHQVVIKYPGSGCSDGGGSFCVSVCETDDCIIKRSLFVTLATTFFVSLLLYLFNSTQSILAIIAVVGLVLSIIIYLSWKECAKRCNKCPRKLAIWQIALASFIGFILLGESSIGKIYQWLLGAFSFAGPWAPVLAIIVMIIIAVIIILIIWLLYKNWVNKCCPTECQKWVNILMAVVICGLVVGILWGVLDSLGPTVAAQYTIPFWGAILGLLGAYAAVKVASNCS